MNNYSLIKELQSGSFGTAHLAENKKSGKKVVVKEKVTFTYDKLLGW